jgi:hypothetical protein
MALYSFFFFECLTLQVQVVVSWHCKVHNSECFQATLLISSTYITSLQLQPYKQYLLIILPILEHGKSEISALLL